MLWDNQQLRYGTVKHSYTNWQRIMIWFNGVVQAIRTVPDRDYSDFVLVRPGEAGYDDAPFGCVVDDSAPRYRIENGEWIQVNPTEEPTEINPDWHNASP